MSRTQRVLYPGEELLGWLPLAGLLLMALNDHWLRLSYPCWITGKLSDIAVVAYLPFLVTSVVRIVILLLDKIWLVFTSGQRRLDWRFDRNMLILGMAVTAMGLSMINISYTVRDLFLSALETLDVFDAFGTFRYTVDPFDCLALLELPLVWLYGKKRFEERRSTIPLCP